MLLASGKASWVERNEIDRILKEQELQAAFGAANARDRLALGKLLKADVLVLLRNVRSAAMPPAIECVVCETRQGLRLKVASVLTTLNYAAMAGTLEKVVQEALHKQAEQIGEIVAVSPLVSDDLGLEHNYLQTGFAKVVEQMLLESPGVAVVELAEAQAISQELARAAPTDTVGRGHRPLYVFGRFRHYGSGDQQTISVRLRLVRGEQELARFEQRDLAPAAAPGWLRQKARALMTSAGLAPPESIEPAAEARQLAERAAQFQKIGNGEEALALIEASLLLDPNQPQLHHDAVVVCEWLIRQCNDQRLRKAGAVRDGAAYYLRGLAHLETFLRAAGPITEFRKGQAPDFAWYFMVAGYSFAGGDDGLLSAENRAVMVQARSQAVDRYLQMARARTQRGFTDGAGPTMR